MIKSLGLGICCLTLTISGVTRASVLPVDGGKFGDCKKHEKIDKDCKFDLKDCDIKDIDFTSDEKHDLKDICADKKDLKADFKDLKSDKEDLERDLKNNASCEDIKRDKEDIKADWRDIKADEKDLKHDVCDLHADLGCDVHEDHVCAAVPAPASAAFGGLGVAGIMLMAGLRSRRSGIC